MNKELIKQGIRLIYLGYLKAKDTTKKDRHGWYVWNGDGYAVVVSENTHIQFLNTHLINND